MNGYDGPEILIGFSIPIFRKETLTLGTLYSFKRQPDYEPLGEIISDGSWIPEVITTPQGNILIQFTPLYILKTRDLGPERAYEMAVSGNLPDGYSWRPARPNTKGSNT
jgi:hypothetical protein